ncbi:MAG: LysM peptidoglycan-binding domain-containing protein [Pseudomonas lundensis]|uniref:LysM peptidoglycan-binding domain-containing protein n=1 Tax=Pseudomonas lundensis TaxID=86185 RepID=UPI0009BA8635|nr:LysM domain-containing protein [Pseudomonas lundensis]NLU01770.1 LysM peptidoglycan-binding domain-containing protein [Pseudomonas lundensis]NNA29469.1 LysM peptidoglycan-binding domain-containing protein [Pseudomonas lundensis]NNA38649.1 LysM peptidoglycan-binding domain-containing protein [Pseudomonas lundensis]
MSTTYIVKYGDTLSEIAQQLGVKMADLQALNPFIADPDFLREGWALRLPDTPSQPSLPPPANDESATCIALMGQTECDEELVEVVHITGDPYFYVLTETQCKALKQETTKVQALMDELHQNLANSLPVTQCKKPQAPSAECTCTRCVKDVWSAKAQLAGLLMREPAPQANNAAPLTSENDLEGELATLQKARDWYQHYWPTRALQTRVESNWETLRAKKTQALDQQISKLQAQRATQPKAVPASGAFNSGSTDSETNANDAAPDLKHGRGRSSRREGGIQSRTGILVLEISVFGDPARRYYIPYRLITAWHVRVSTRVMAGKPFNKQLAKDLIKDIKEAISDGRKAGPLGNLELKIGLWNSQTDNLLNALHKEVAWTTDQSGAMPYAVSAQAHALRFAASASAGVNSWEPEEGNIDVGVKGSAAFSLGEGSVSFDRYFPDKGGYVATMAYRNALGEEVLHPMGVFRLGGKLELSCFVGAKSQVETGVNIQYKPSETPAGATALLGPPTMEVGRSGYVGVKCDAFAGAQTGGALSGFFEWIEPDEGGKAIRDPARGNWVKLAEVKGEGNIAWGAGMSGEFGITISKDRLAFNCKGSLVFGPGAGGGFGTVVELDQVGKLALLFCNALADMDYRYLIGVTEEAFSYIASGLYQAATFRAKELGLGFENGLNDMRTWWKERKSTRKEADDLANYLIMHKDNKSLRIREQNIPLSVLPPETIGPMVYLLTEGVIAKGIGSFNEKQEQALVILLSEVRRWRHFIEVLEHCSRDATKVNAMQSLERINALLDGYEQNEFNRFIDNLVMNQTFDNATRIAWTPSNAWRKEKILVAAQRSGRFEGLV